MSCCLSLRANTVIHDLAAGYPYGRLGAHWVAVGDNGLIIQTFDKAETWHHLYSGLYGYPDLYAVGRHSDSRASANWFPMCGWGDDGPAHYQFYIHNQGPTDFVEYQYNFKHRVTAITKCYSSDVLAVTDGGEIGCNGGTFPTDFRLVCELPVGLFAVTFGYSNAAFVGGENGYLASAYGGSYRHDDWNVIDSGITTTINAIAYGDQDYPVFAVGANGGQFAYSLNGIDFERLDIGFGSDDINAIAYNNHDGCFYVAGGYGR